jgi:hypothetical protein
LNVAGYRWSSATAHLTEEDEFQIIDMDWWRASDGRREWSKIIACEEDADAVTLRASTYAGRPYGEAAFVADVAARFGRRWQRGRPRTEVAIVAHEMVQSSLH